VTADHHGIKYHITAKITVLKIQNSYKKSSKYGNQLVYITNEKSSESPLISYTEYNAIASNMFHLEAGKYIPKYTASLPQNCSFSVLKYYCMSFFAIFGDVVPLNHMKTCRLFERNLLPQPLVHTHVAGYPASLVLLSQTTWRHRLWTLNPHSPP
jgi:hypothetical protein